MVEAVNTSETLVKFIRHCTAEHSKKVIFWDRVFEFHPRHGCKSVSLCVILPCVGNGLARGQSPLKELYKRHNRWFQKLKNPQQATPPIVPKRLQEEEEENSSFADIFIGPSSELIYYHECVSENIYGE
jgi:hypothetical protein